MRKLLAVGSVLAIVVVLGRFYAEPVLAQVRAAFVQNVDEPGRTPYQQEVQTAGVCGTEFCVSNFRFSPVPAGKRLVVKNVSVSIQAYVGAAMLPVFLSGGSTLVQGTTGLFPIAETPIPFTAPPTNPFVFGSLCPAAKPCVLWSLSQPVDYYVEAGSSPIVVANVDFNHNAPFVTIAALTGYYVSLP